MGLRKPRSRERGPAVARVRLLKPGFFTNEVLANCSFPARLLFAGLWCLADCEGKLEDRPKKIKAEILPYDTVDIENLLAELEEHGFIVRYKIGSRKQLRRYILIPTFAKHQNPHPKERPQGYPDPIIISAEKNGEPRISAAGNGIFGASRAAADPGSSDPGSSAAAGNAAAALAAAAQEVPERREEELIEALCHVGCPPGIAQSAVRNGVDLKHIGTVIRWLANNPGKIKKPGGYHDLLHRPQKFAFVQTEEGWNPPQEERSLKDRMQEHLSRSRTQSS